jgi:hypothetical protein
MPVALEQAVRIQLVISCSYLYIFTPCFDAVMKPSESSGNDVNKSIHYLYYRPQKKGH